MLISRYLLKDLSQSLNMPISISLISQIIFTEKLYKYNLSFFFDGKNEKSNRFLNIYLWVICDEKQDLSFSRLKYHFE